MKKGIIYLSGGGDENKTAIIDSFFLKKLQNKDLLFIPIAKSGDRNSYKKSCVWLFDKLNAQSKDPVRVSLLLDFKKDISGFSAIYIGGGNTYKLLTIMKNKNFLLILEDYIQNGGVVYGASAGAVLMGMDISTYIEEKYLSENIENNYTFTKGMGLVGPYSVLTHFRESDLYKIKEYFGRKDDPVMAIPEGVAVIVENNSATVIGDNAIIIFEKSGPIKKITPNQTFDLCG